MSKKLKIVFGKEKFKDEALFVSLCIPIGYDVNLVWFCTKCRLFGK